MTHHSEASKPRRPIESGKSVESVASVELASFSDTVESPDFLNFPDSPRSGDSLAHGDVTSPELGGSPRPKGWTRPAASGQAPPARADHASRDALAPEPSDSADHRAAGRTGPGGRTESAVVFSHPDHPGRPGRPGRSGLPTGGSDGERDAPDPARHVAAMAAAQAEQVVLRSPAELADALPYLLGYRPEDSIVLVAIHDRQGYGSFGGRVRLGIPARDEDWPEVARQMARCLVSGCERRGARPEGIVAFVCRDSPPGGTRRQVMESLRPLAQLLRTECGSLDIPVLEALCMSDGHFWSYCCPDLHCCPPEGTPLGLPGASVLSAAMTYAGLQVRGTLKEFRARLVPWETAAALEQESALDAAGMALVARILDKVQRAEVAGETLDLGRRVLGRLAAAPHVPDTLEADQRDDELITHQEAAALILGLQDRTTRDQAAEWVEEGEAGPALRMWRALARRCVGPYGEHAAAPLTLAGWVAWSMGDELEAREALAMALGVDPGYVFARLLHQACNDGLDPEAIRRCLRRERANRTSASSPSPSSPSGHLAKAAAAPAGHAAPADPTRDTPAEKGSDPTGRGPRAATGLPRAERPRRPESRGPAHGRRRRARPTRARAAGTGPGALRPPGRRATGRG
jgi:hypothetical protein